MFNRIILVLTIGLVATGFGIGSVGIHVRFDTIDGLKMKDRVVSDEVHIGRVKKVVYGDDGNYTASLDIKKDFKGVLTEHTRFVITDDPQYDGRKAVELIQIRVGGTPLKSGTTVSGTDKYTVLLEMMRDDAKEGIAYLKQEYRQFSDGLRSLSESDKIRRLKEAITRLGGELKEESREIREKITDEIIPMLEHEIEELREELKEYGREEEVEPLEEELKKIQFI